LYLFLQNKVILVATQSNRLTQINGGVYNFS